LRRATRKPIKPASDDHYGHHTDQYRINEGEHDFLPQRLAILGIISQSFQYFGQFAGLFASIDHRPENFREGVRKGGHATSQGLALEDATAHSGNHGPGFRRFALLDQNVQALFQR
jgi:hypothetical protein